MQLQIFPNLVANDYKSHVVIYGVVTFWLISINEALLSTIMDIANAENPVQLPYCGLKNMRPLTTYTPFRDLNVGNFMLVKSHDPNLVSLQMGRVKGDVVKDEENEYFKMVKVQWWVLVKKGSKLDEHLYDNC